MSFIDRHARDPFFLYLAFFAPHVPLESPEPWFSKTPKTLTKERRQALAMIAAMDEGIGRIRAKLREQGNEKNTLIFFINGNGAPTKEGAWDGSLNLPLVGEKGMLTDGGIRTPFVAAIRMDHWKYIRVGPDERYLFELNAPEGESELAKNNLVGKFPEVAANLEKRLMEWNATLPPPGLPRPPFAKDEMFYDAYVKNTGAKGGKKIPKDAPAPASAGSDWVVRNAAASIKDGALRITPDADAAQGFIAFSKLRITGPAVATASIRSENGGKLGIAWRLEGQDDFPAEQMIVQDIKGSAETLIATSPRLRSG